MECHYEVLLVRLTNRLIVPLRQLFVMATALSNARNTIADAHRATHTHNPGNVLGIGNHCGRMDGRGGDTVDAKWIRRLCGEDVQIPPAKLPLGNDSVVQEVKLVRFQAVTDEDLLRIALGNVCVKERLSNMVPCVVKVIY